MKYDPGDITITSNETLRIYTDTGYLLLHKSGSPIYMDRTETPGSLKHLDTEPVVFSCRKLHEVLSDFVKNKT